MDHVEGSVRVWISKDAECYGGRVIHVSLAGLPGWLLSLISEAGPFRREASTYRGAGIGDGPHEVLLTSTLVVGVTEPRPRTIEKTKPEPATEES